MSYDNEQTPKAMTPNFLHRGYGLRFELQEAQENAKAEMDLRGYDWNDEDEHRVYEWLHESLMQAAKRNNSHVYWRWEFVQNQLEHVLHQELYMFNWTLPDACWFYGLLKDFCEHFHLELEVTDKRIIIGWDSDDDM